MPQITYVDTLGNKRTVEVRRGWSVMEGAVQNGIPGIVAECGGACSCATCHVYVDDAWITRVGAPLDTEKAMLEFVHDPRPNSRLSCQISVGPELDGLCVHTPDRQG